MNRVHPGAVVVSGIVFWIIQAGWYTAFKGAYIAAVGLSPEAASAAQDHPSPWPYVTALLANMLVAYVISIVLVRTGEATVARGLIIALVLWGGLVMTQMATRNAFEMRPFSLLLINGGCALLGMLATGIICGAWTKQAPAA